MDRNKLEEIHELNKNGDYDIMMSKINQYDKREFWKDYYTILHIFYETDALVLSYFRRSIVKYMNRTK